jgi:hypothetical protein
VDHVQIAGRIKGDAVRGLPGEPVRELRELVADAIPVGPLADDRLVAEPAGAGRGGTASKRTTGTVS